MPSLIYHEYIESPEWQVKREAALERCGRKCQLCSSTLRLNVHHNTYERLGEELDVDLTVLCRRCHEAFHAKVDPRTKRKMPKAARLAPMPEIPAPPGALAKGMIRVQVTQEYLDALVRHGGPAITARGMRLVGDVWPPKRGWKRRALGREIEVDERMLKAELRRIRSKFPPPTASVLSGIPGLVSD